MVFPARRKVIFVHGCFWHGHDCAAGENRPASNRRYWTRKLRLNQARDAANEKRLRELGWESLVVWECELRLVPRVARRIADFLEGGRG